MERPEDKFDDTKLVSVEFEVHGKVQGECVKSYESY